MPRPRSRLVIAVLCVWLALLTTACGILEPTPARFRPPLPRAQPMPGLAVEELVALLEADGFDCRFDPATDIPPSWGCQSGDGAEGSLSVSMQSEQTGQIHSASAHLQIGAVGEEVPEDRLDAEATQGFHPFVSAIVPEEHRPSLDELGAGVRSNFPMDLGGGWYLGFDRNIISRSLTIIFSEE